MHLRLLTPGRKTKPGSWAYLAKKWAWMDPEWPPQGATPVQPRIGHDSELVGQKAKDSRIIYFVCVCLIDFIF